MLIWPIFFGSSIMTRFVLMTLYGCLEVVSVIKLAFPQRFCFRRTGRRHNALLCLTSCANQIILIAWGHYRRNIIMFNKKVMTLEFPTNNKPTKQPIKQNKQTKRLFLKDLRTQCDLDITLVMHIWIHRLWQQRFKTDRVPALRGETEQVFSPLTKKLSVIDNYLQRRIGFVQWLLTGYINWS